MSTGVTQTIFYCLRGDENPLYAAATGVKNAGSIPDHSVDKAILSLTTLSYVCVILAGLSQCGQGSVRGRVEIKLASVARQFPYT
jgi:hypothetical protein